MKTSLRLLGLALLVLPHVPPRAEEIPWDPDADHPETGINPGHEYGTASSLPLPPGLPQAPYFPELSIPALLHAGRSCIEEPILSLPGELDVELRRIAISGVNLSGAEFPVSPFGNWACSHNWMIEEQPNGGVRVSGSGRKDDYAPVTPGVWEGTEALGTEPLDRVLWNGQTFEQVAPGQTVTTYATRVLPNGLRQGRPVEIKTSNGRCIQFVYDMVGDPRQWRIREIQDTLGRKILFSYNAEGLATSIQDPSGRIYSFGYDARKRLKTAATPPLTDPLGIGGAFPAGRQTQYVYLDETGAVPPAMKDFLAGRIGPQEAGTGLTNLRFSYDMASGKTYGYLVGITYGNRDPALGSDQAGGTWTYGYDAMDPNDPKVQAAQGTNKPWVCVTETSPEGRRKKRFLTERGYMLQETVLGAEARFTTTFRYDDHYQLTERQLPSTEKVRYRYDPSPLCRLNLGNLTEVTQLPNALGGTEQITTFVVDPIFNQVVRSTNPRGSMTETVFIYDWQEAWETAVTTYAPRLGVSPEALRQALLSRQILDQPDRNGDGMEGPLGGNLICRIAPTATLPAEASGLTDDLSQESEEQWQYDSWGQPTRYRDAIGAETIREYEPAPNGGGLLKKEIRMGAPGSFDDRVAEYSWNACGELVKQVTPLGVVHEYLRNELGELIEIRAAKSYDAVRKDPQIQGPALDHYIRWTRDGDGRVVKTWRERTAPGIPPEGNSLDTYERDILGQITRIIEDAEGLLRTTEFSYDADGYPTQQIFAPGKPEESRTVLTYTPSGRFPYKRQMGLGTALAVYETRYGYDGLPSRSFDPEGHATLFSRDGFGRPTRVTAPNGSWRQTAYDAGDNVVRSESYGIPTEPPGSPVKLAAADYVYDERERLVAEHQLIDFTPGRPVDGIRLEDAGVEVAGGHIHDDSRLTTVFIYTKTDWLAAEVNDHRQMTRYGYSLHGDLVEMAYPAGQADFFWHNRGGNRVKHVRVRTAHPLPLTRNPEAQETLSFYDALGRPVEERHAGIFTTRWSYDASGNVVSMLDPQGQLQKYAYDALGRLQTHKRFPQAGQPITVTTEYDALDRVKARIDPSGNRTENDFDPLGRLREMRYANGTRETWDYDRLGQPTHHQDPNGSVFIYSFDPNGNLTRTDITPGAGIPGPYAQGIAYDGLDRPITVIEQPTPDPSNVVKVTMTYDTTDRRIEETQQAGSGAPVLATRQSYQGLRNIETHCPNGALFYRKFDSLNRPVQMGDAGGIFANFSYLGLDQLLYDKRGARVVGDFRYDGQSFPVDWDQRTVKTAYARSTASGSTPVMSVTHRFNLARRVAQESDPLLNVVKDFLFDGADRLVQALRNGAAFAQWEQDPSGNWTRFWELPHGEHNPVLDGSGMNRYAAFDQKQQVHDANGNRTQDGDYEFTYDALNRLRKITQQGVPVASYGYDALGRRIRKDRGALGSQSYLYDGLQILEVRDGTGAVTDQILHHPGRFGFQVARNLYTDGQLAARHFPLVDSQGNLSTVVDNEGIPILHAEYSQHGWPTLYNGAKQPITPAQMPFTEPYVLAQGQWWDPVAGLYHSPTRDLDPKTGRYHQPDRVGAMIGHLVDDAMRATGDGYLEIPFAARVTPTGTAPQYADPSTTGIPYTGMGILGRRDPLGLSLPPDLAREVDMVLDMLEGHHQGLGLLDPTEDIDALRSRISDEIAELRDTAYPTSGNPDLGKLRTYVATLKKRAIKYIDGLGERLRAPNPNRPHPPSSGSPRLTAAPSSDPPSEGKGWTWRDKGKPTAGRPAGGPPEPPPGWPKDLTYDPANNPFRKKFGTLPADPMPPPPSLTAPPARIVTETPKPPKIPKVRVRKVRGGVLFFLDLVLGNIIEYFNECPSCGKRMQLPSDGLGYDPYIHGGCTGTGVGHDMI